MQIEQWLPIKDYPAYSVSSFGNIRSESRPLAGGHGSIRVVKARILRPRLIGSDNRLAVQLCLNGNARNRYVARLVCAAFWGEPKANEEVSHINGNKLDNNASNLVWETHIENEKRKELHGTKPRGERSGSARLNQKQIEEIRTRYNSGPISQYKLALQYGVSQGHIARIIARKRWAHI